MEAEKKGVLKKYKIELIGANSRAISNAEDRKKFRKNMLDIGLDMMRGRFDEPRQEENEADREHPQDGAPQEPQPHSLAVELLPEATPTQHKSMDDFIKAPSRDKWLELVESMRLQRESNLLHYIIILSIIRAIS